MPTQQANTNNPAYPQQQFRNGEVNGATDQARHDSTQHSFSTGGVANNQYHHHQAYTSRAMQVWLDQTPGQEPWSPESHVAGRDQGGNNGVVSRGKLPRQARSGAARVVKAASMNV
ncbi:hypothetical protein MMC24_004474 [Lignoscripta atroalba]|nr:hypothetical protein [Lignoscripta atroalba]